jgi:hypothetical protein
MAVVLFMIGLHDALRESEQDMSTRDDFAIARKRQGFKFIGDS